MKYVFKKGDKRTILKNIFFQLKLYVGIVCCKPKDYKLQLLNYF